MIKVVQDYGSLCFESDIERDTIAQLTRENGIVDFGTEYGAHCMNFYSTERATLVLDWLENAGLVVPA